MKAISTREFRDNQRMYFDLVDANEKVIVQRGKNKAYLIVPIEEMDDLDSYMANPENIASLKRGIEDVKAGRVYKVKGKEDLKKFLDNL